MEKGTNYESVRLDVMNTLSKGFWENNWESCVSDWDAFQMNLYVCPACNIPIHTHLFKDWTTHPMGHIFNDSSRYKADIEDTELKMINKVQLLPWRTGKDSPVSFVVVSPVSEIIHDAKEVLKIVHLSFLPSFIPLSSLPPFPPSSLPSFLPSLYPFLPSFPSFP